MSDNKIHDGLFPDVTASNEEKATKEYGIQEAKAIYHKYMSAPTSIYNRISRYIMNRKYAEGLQSIQKYKDMLDMNGDTSYLNLDFQVVPVIPKFVDTIVGEMIKQDMTIQCNAIDDNSLSNYEKEKAAIFFNMKMKGFSDKMEELTGKPLIDKSKPVFEDEEEAKLYMEMTFKQDTEIAMEEILSYIIQNNNDQEIKMKVIRDLVVLKIAAIRLDYDENGDIIVRYVDPVALVTPYSDKQNFTDMMYCGEQIKMTIHDLKQMAGDQLDDECYWNIAKKMVGQHGNPMVWNFGETYGAYYNRGGMNAAYDSYYVKVFDFEFASNTYNMTFEKKYNNYGGFFYNKKSKGYTPAENSRGKREVDSKNIQVRYEGKWIVGTDYIFDYGLQKNMRRPKRKESYAPKCLSRYIVCAPDIYDMENKSLVERMIPHADQIQLAYLKMQQLIALAIPKGVAFDVSVLEGVVKGKGKDFLSPLEIVSAFKQTGHFAYRGTDPDTGNPVNVRPITEMENGMSHDVERLVNVYNFHVSMIRDVTGINEFRDGSTPDPRTLSGVQKTAIQSSLNSTAPLNNAYINMFKRAAEQLTIMVQCKAQYGGGLKGYYNAIGEGAVKILELGDEISMSEFGIGIELLPTAADQAQLEQDIAMGLQTQNIDIEDAWEVRTLARKNIKKAVRLLKKRRDDKQAKTQEEALQMQQANAQTQIQSSQAASQAKMQEIQAEAQAKAQLINLEYQWKMKIAEMETQVRSHDNALNNQAKLQQTVVDNHHDMVKTRMESQNPEPRIFPSTVEK